MKISRAEPKGTIYLLGCLHSRRVRVEIHNEPSFAADESDNHSTLFTCSAVAMTKQTHLGSGPRTWNSLTPNACYVCHCCLLSWELKKNRKEGREGEKEGEREKRRKRREEGRREGKKGEREAGREGINK